MHNHMNCVVLRRMTRDRTGVVGGMKKGWDSMPPGLAGAAGTASGCGKEAGTGAADAGTGLGLNKAASKSCRSKTLPVAPEGAGAGIGTGCNAGSGDGTTT